VQQEAPLDGCGEFLALVEARVDRVVGLFAVGHGCGEPVVVKGAASDRVGHRRTGDLFGDLPGLVFQVVPFFVIDRHDLTDQLHEMILGEIGPPVKGLEVGRQEYGHGPAAAAGHHLHRFHVDAIQVGPFLAIDLDADEVLVHELGHVDMFEDLVLHHMAPVARRIPDRKENGLVFGARPGQGFFAPGVPIQGIVGVLLQVDRGFIDQVVAVAHDFLRSAGAGRGAVAAVGIVHGASRQDEGHQAQGDQADRGCHSGVLH